MLILIHTEEIGPGRGGAFTITQRLYEHPKRGRIRVVVHAYPDGIADIIRIRNAHTDHVWGLGRPQPKPPTKTRRRSFCEAALPANPSPVDTPSPSTREAAVKAIIGGAARS